MSRTRGIGGYLFTIAPMSVIAAELKLVLVMEGSGPAIGDRQRG